MKLEDILTVIFILLFVSLLIFGLVKFLTWVNNESEQRKIERKVEYFDCMEKTNDQEWCYEWQ